MTVPVAGDSLGTTAILGIRLWAAAVARANQRRLELTLDHRLDEFAHPVTQLGFDRIKPIIEKMDGRLGSRLRRRRRRAIDGHGVVSTGVPTPGSFGFQHSETTPS